MDRLLLRTIMMIMTSAYMTSIACADVQRAMDALQNDDIRTAVTELLDVKNELNTEQEFVLGTLYFAETSVVHNNAEAAKWFSLAANKGHADSQYHIALMNDHGLGIVKNMKVADKWYLAAAKQDHSAAQVYWAFRYAIGKGVIQNYSMAHMYFNLAARNGDETAFEMRSKLELQMTASQIEKAQQMAVDWVDKFNKGS